MSAQGPKKLLFLTHAALYKHTSLGPAEKAVTELGKTGGFEVTTVEGYKQDSKQLDFSFLTPEYLNQFDGVMMMTNGNLPLTDAQKKNLLDFVRGGKALIGAHCASLTFYNYPEFGEMLGGYFNRNLPQGTIAVLKVEDSQAPGHENARRRAGRSSTSSTCSARRRGTRRGPTRTSTCCSRTRSRWASRATRCTSCSASTPSTWT